MGDPRRLKKKYATPNKPFDKNRIEEELKYLGEYGLRNKREFWKHRYQLSRLRQRARQARSQSEEVQALMLKDLRQKLSRLGILGPDASFDDVLGLSIESLLERRLQTLVFRKGLAKSIYQARQFITHRHIQVNGKIITSPSYLVKAEEEDSIEYAINSPLRNLTLSQIEGGGSSTENTEEEG